MEASKLILTDKTLESLNNSLLRPKAKAKLRKRLIKEYIESKPYGTQVSLSTVSNILRLSNSGSHSFMTRLVKSGELNRFPKGKGYYYTVANPIKVTHLTPDEKKEELNKLEPVMQTEPREEPVKEPEDNAVVVKNATLNPAVQPQTARSYTLEELEALAMKCEFYFQAWITEGCRPSTITVAAFPDMA